MAASKQKIAKAILDAAYDDAEKITIYVFSDY